MCVNIFSIAKKTQRQQEDQRQEEHTTTTTTKQTTNIKLAKNVNCISFHIIYQQLHMYGRYTHFR